MNQPSPYVPPLSAAAAYGIDFVRKQLGALRFAVLTGAGLSTDSGIPDYRGAGRVARNPMSYDEFIGSEDARKRYWSRSFFGWQAMAQAKPNRGHFALAEAQKLQKVQSLITQNVDGLHQAAGSTDVIDLHGRLDRVVCLKCRETYPRELIEMQMRTENPTLQADADIEFAPDGDAEIETPSDFRVPDCIACSGSLKPDVVFFGESVPQDKVEASYRNVDDAEALLVAGSSLTVNSGMRFVRHAVKGGKPVVIVNLGATKADSLALAKIEANTSYALESIFLD